MPPPKSNPIQLAEKILTLLDQGSFVATYKFAVLLGLMDLCLEKTSGQGRAPAMVTTRELAEKVVELYWPHSLPFRGLGGKKVLKQNTGRQARILGDILRFRQKVKDATLPLQRARRASPQEWEKLVQRIEWTLINMPLPRLQFFGRKLEPFLYDIAWDIRIDRYKVLVTRYQKGGESPFDNRIHFKPGVAQDLVLLNGLLRPLIHRQWSAMVAQINKLQESELEAFLFGADRINLDPVRKGLRELQNNRCFYCAKPMSGPVDVDHFIPWARYPDNGIENLVAAHKKCNHAKRDFLAAGDHVDHWARRLQAGSSVADQLEELARHKQWESHGEQTLSVARGIYLRLPPETLLWKLSDQFVPANRLRLQKALGAV